MSDFVTRKNSTWVQDIFIDELREDCLLGSGSFGIVFLGYHTQFGSVAYKRFFDTGFNRTLNQREIDTLLMFNGHPNIVRIYGLLCERKASQSHFGFVMEWMKYSLHKVINDDPTEYDIDQAVKWFHGIASGLNVMHAHKIIHRDIRPDNVLTDESFEQIRLCDFGLSTRYRSKMSAGVGTVGFMAPELCNTSEYCEYTSSCDMYSFGVLMREVLTKRQRTTCFWEQSISMELNNIIESCCTRNSDSRPTSQNALDALVAIQEELSTLQKTLYKKKEDESRIDQQIQDTKDKEENVCNEAEQEKRECIQRFHQVLYQDLRTARKKYERVKLELQEEIVNLQETGLKLKVAEEKVQTALEDFEQVKLQLQDVNRRRQETEKQQRIVEERTVFARKQKESADFQLPEEIRMCEEAERKRIVAEEQSHAALQEYQRVRQKREEENFKRQAAENRRRIFERETQIIHDEVLCLESLIDDEHRKLNEAKQDRQVADEMTRALGEVYRIQAENRNRQEVADQLTFEVEGGRARDTERSRASFDSGHDYLNMFEEIQIQQLVEEQSQCAQSSLNPSQAPTRCPNPRPSQYLSIGEDLQFAIERLRESAMETPEEEIPSTGEFAEQNFHQMHSRDDAIN